MIQKVVLLALAGASGTLARYGLASAVHRMVGSSFIWGTMIANISGCFLAGLMCSLFEQKWPMSAEARLLILVGFMGAFTTFSAFILETGELVQTSQWIHAVSNILIQNSLGFAALFAGITLGKVL